MLTDLKRLQRIPTVIGTSLVPEFKRCRFSSLGRSVRWRESEKRRPEKDGSRRTATCSSCSRTPHLVTAAYQSRASLWRSIYQGLHKKNRKNVYMAGKKRTASIKINVFTRFGSTPDVTSTSTGRMMNWSSLGALVFILMKAVWLSTSLDEKLALITPFVSKGGISCREKVKMGDSDSPLSGVVARIRVKIRVDTNTETWN